MTKDIIAELMGLDQDDSCKVINDPYIKTSDCHYKNISIDSDHPESSDESYSSDEGLIKVNVDFQEYPLNSTLSTHDVTLDINDDIPIKVIPPINTEKNEIDNLMIEGINNFKDYVKSTIDKLYETIDFLKQELVEKNILIRALTSRDLNNNNISDGDKRNNSISIGPYANSANVDHKRDIPNETFNKERNHIQEAVENTSETMSTLGERYPWQLHSSGAATKIMENMGYKGKGLGKSENGITEPISIKRPELDKGKKKLYIISSSMLNQIDEKRLSTNNVEVKVRCHGGCTVKCSYSHLPELFREKPDYVLLHIGSNDCTSKTSDEVLNEIEQLTKYISKTLPCAKIIISLPIVRADNARAGIIQKNLKLKLKRLFYPCLENSNIDLSDLGKKGLHLNQQGTRKMAGNIISLIKRL